jgi:alkylhydroperoxidase family enzyme
VRTGSAGTIERDDEDLLRRLALNDERAIARLLGGDDGRSPSNGPGDRAATQLRLAALVAMQAAPASYQLAVSNALAAGVTESEIVDVLCAVAPVTGAARVHSAATALADALGYGESAGGSRGGAG